MRRVSRFLARIVAVAVVIVALGAPVEARTTPREPSFTKERAVKTVKGWVKRVFDRLSVPKP